MQLPNVMNVQLHQVQSGNISCHWNEMSHFHKLIGDHVDGIESIGFQQFTDEVRLNPLPWAIRSRIS
jgi:hypothetical protein